MAGGRAGRCRTRIAVPFRSDMAAVVQGCCCRLSSVAAAEVSACPCRGSKESENQWRSASVGWGVVRLREGRVIATGVRRMERRVRLAP
jgi:hypothetical protein